MEQKETTLLIGDKVDITNDGRHFYKTMIGDIYDNGHILIGVPIYRGTAMRLELHEIIYLVFYRESGRYITQMNVLGFDIKDSVRYAVLEQLTPPEKNQRREFYRLPDRADILLCEYTDGVELTLALKDDIREAVKLADAVANDISVTGVSLSVKRECRLGERYLLKIYLSGTKSKSPPFLICAEVKRSSYSFEDYTYNVGLRFFGLPKSKREFLNKYILSQQQKKIVQRKLADGEK